MSHISLPPSELHSTLSVSRIGLDSIATFLARWVLVLVVLLGLFALATGLAFQRIRSEREQTVNAIGYFIGWLVFIIVIVLDSMGKLGSMSFLESNLWLANLVVGLVVGFCLLGLVDRFLTFRARSLFIALVCGGSLIGLFFYIHHAQYRDSMMMITTGLLAGLLLYVWLMPDVLNKLREQRRQPGRAHA